MEADAFRRKQEDRLELDPVLAKINDRVRDLGMEKLQATLDGKSTELFDERLRQLHARHEARTQSLGLIPYRCSICKDTGVDGSGYCRCLRKRIYMEHYGAYDPMASPISLETYSFAIFDRVPENGVSASQAELTQIAYNVCQAIVYGKPGDTPNLFLHGNPGLGKSQLVGALARTAAERGIDTVFIHAVPMFDAYHKERLGYPVQMDFLETAHLLIVDDLGAEPMTTNVTTESLLRLLTYRLERRLPSVFVTNQTDVQLRYGERIASRMRGSTAFTDVLIQGTDLRDSPTWGSSEEKKTRKKK